MQRRQENIDFLLRCIERYEASHSDNDKSLAALLSRLALDPPREGDEQDQGRVLLSTLHGVKGLEFDVVFIAGCVEGQLPHNRSLMPKVSDVAPTAIEEERRLFYVGVTRARERLYLMVPEKRSLRGQTMPLVPSRFLTGLPADAIEERRYVAAQTTDFDDIADFSGQLIAQLQGGV